MRDHQTHRSFGVRTFLPEQLNRNPCGEHDRNDDSEFKFPHDLFPYSSLHPYAGATHSVRRFRSTPRGRPVQPPDRVLQAILPTNIQTTVLPVSASEDPAPPKSVWLVPCILVLEER